MNDYEEKRAARVERLRARAGNKLAERAAIHGNVQRLGEIMNGQPVLIGHHSERRHRRDLDRMSTGMRKACELHRDAEELERRADAAERSTAISSDDPEAVRKLKERIAAVERHRDRCKSVNAAIRAAKKKGGEWKPEARDLLAGVGLSAMAIDAVLDGRSGKVPGYVLTNAGADIRRLKKRLEQIEASAKREGTEKVIGDVRIVEEDNRVRIVFPGKPAEEIRRELKSYGFRWAPSVEAWQRHASPQAWRYAERIVGALNGA